LDGKMYLFGIENPEESIIGSIFGKASPKLTSKHLGTTSRASTLAYLGNSRIFLGSLMDDSLLLRVNETSN
jgi:hypothetical protein